MISAFGVEHGEISKGMSPGKLKGLLAANKSGYSGSHPKSLSRAGDYAGQKITAHRYGKERAKLGKRPTGYWMSGETNGRFARDQLEVLNTKKPGRNLP